MNIKVDNGKYEFVCTGGWRIDVLRHGEQWVQNVDAAKAVYSLMAELDAARLVVAEARKCIDSGLVPELVAALDRHTALVGKPAAPSSWATGAGKSAD